MNKLIVVNAPSLSKLQIKSLGYNHDHCQCHYFGKSEDIPHELRIQIHKPTGYYCAIFEEHRSYNPAFIKKIKQSMRQIEQGKTKKIDVNNIWESV